MTALSVVVACRDRAALLDASLPALTGALRPGDELVVVDAASRTADVAEVARGAGARVVSSSRPGAAAARNVGWRAATGQLIAFVDDDCRPAPGWADAIATALRDLDAVCGQMIGDGDGHLSVIDDPTARDYAVTDDPSGFGHGGNVAVRRTALDAISGWDERLGPGTRWPGAEDKDLLMRLLAAGCTVGYRPEPVVRHLQWRSRREALRAELGYARGTGALTVKHRLGLAGVFADAGRTLLRDIRGGYRFGIIAGIQRIAGIAWGATGWALQSRRLS